MVGRVAISRPSSSEPVDPQLVELVAGGDCFASIGRRLLLQAARPDSLDVDLDPGRMGPRGGLIGERFLTPKS